ncbi:hypothetical protein QSU92_00740 [Microbacterium sp. ET2]|uniref:hypothetical protein n=1 Tax=Microbacterium albipurpureum TaxID=3050384 RepID=UPI00259C7E4D|nr:hypothetical protein [Microbacterium sp. ET2 (Ac-2212)]WJL95790.1 hypothetical protein QSU92_00740 [Microbacterium sp. ET2 (Ac-2212)]
MSQRHRSLTAIAAVALALTLLAGCAPEPAPTTPSTPTQTSEPSTSPTESPSESPSESPTATASIPTDCNELGSEESRQEMVGDMTLQSDGQGFVRPAPEGATLQLGCDWIVGDATGLLVLISTAAPDAVTAAVAALPEEGYSCQVADDFGAQFCELPGSGPDTEEFVVARDDVWIYYAPVNRNGRAFLSDIASQIFG